MKYYLAPLEGITNMYYRKALDKHYQSLDKVFIPFLNPFECSIPNKNIREVTPKNNLVNAKVIPQIISKNSKDTIWLIKYLNDLGYDEINLNFGCPSPITVNKGKGSGMLRDLDYMDNYLKDIFENTNCDISIKLRLGIESISEFEGIMNVLNKYPLKELIIHPRTTREKYSGKLHLDVLDNFNCKFDIIYNGEIKSLDDINYIQNRFPYIKGVMIGRGIIAIPDMLNINIENRLEKLKSYYYDFSHENIELFGWGSSKFFHKAIWTHMINYFIVPKNISKKLFKCNKLDEFEALVKQIFDECPINNERDSIKNYI